MIVDDKHASGGLATAACHGQALRETFRMLNSPLGQNISRSNVQWPDIGPSGCSRVSSPRRMALRKSSAFPEICLLQPS